MPRAHIVNKIKIIESSRVAQLRGIFDLKKEKTSEENYDVDLPLDEKPWNIGLIVGPSGSGKSSIARELFGDDLISEFDWPPNKSIIDAFQPNLGIKEIVMALSSVGFGSPPNWLRPFSVLSNGEKFRATIARAMCESGDLIVIDEFTSVVDRTVAKISSAAVAKAIRRGKKKLIAVTCHHDVTRWLDPDWVYDTGVHALKWRRLRGRPKIRLHIQRVDKAIWRVFRRHHYLNTSLAISARCFLVTIDGEPAAFSAVMSFPNKKPAWREHRTVTLPDFQGVGVGNALSEYVAALYAATGRRFISTTSHPAMISHRARSHLWKIIRKSSRVLSPSKSSTIPSFTKNNASSNRLTMGFLYVGPSLEREKAMKFGILPSKET